MSDTEQDGKTQTKTAIKPFTFLATKALGYAMAFALGLVMLCFWPPKQPEAVDAFIREYDCVVAKPRAVGVGATFRCALPERRYLSHAELKRQAGEWQRGKSASAAQGK